MSPPLLCSTSFAYVSILFFTIDNTCENITSAVTALITRQMICSRPDRVLTIRNVRGSTRLSNDIRFVHFSLRILQIRTKLYKLLFINKQFGPQSNVIAQKFISVKNLAGKHRYIFQTIGDKNTHNRGQKHTCLKRVFLTNI